MWKKELPRVAMVERSSICWSFTTLELAPGPAKILSWASSYRSPTPMGNTATPKLAKQQERVYGQVNTTYTLHQAYTEPYANPSWPHTQQACEGDVHAGSRCHCCVSDTVLSNGDAKLIKSRVLIANTSRTTHKIIHVWHFQM